MATSTPTPTSTATPTATGSACGTAPYGLVGWWPGEGNANDIVGGNNGALQSGVGFTPGKVGQAFRFQGAGGVLGSSTTGFPLGSSPRTVAAWVKILPGSQEAGVLHYGVQNANLPPTNIHLALAGGTRPTFANGWGYGGVTSGTSIADDTWHFLAGTYEGPDTNVARIYVDGVEQGSAVITTPGTLDGTFAIGQFLPGDNRTLNGLVDEVEVFNRTLCPAEIQAAFDAGNTGQWWPLQIAPTRDASVQVAYLSGSTAANNDVTLRITYGNTGNSPLMNAVITQTLPSEMIYVSSSGPITPTVARSQVVWAVPSIGPGGSGTIDVVAHVAADVATDRTLTTTVQIAHDRADLNPADNGAATSFVAYAPTFDAFVKTGWSSGDGRAGQQAVLWIDYGNRGNNPVAGVVVTLTLDPNLAYVDSTGGGVAAGSVLTWGMGTVPAYGGGTVFVTVSPTTTLTTNTPVTVSASISTQTAEAPGWDHGLLGSFFNSPFGLGDSLGSVVQEPYRISTLAMRRTDTSLYFDWPGSPGTGVNADNWAARWTGYLWAPLTGSYEFQAQSDSGVRLRIGQNKVLDYWGCCPDTNGSMLLKGGLWYPIQVDQVDGSGPAYLHFWWLPPGTTGWQVIPSFYLATADTVDNNHASFGYPVVALSSDLALQQSVSSGTTTPIAGDEVTFRLHYVNNGNGPATGVQITDTLPISVTYVSSTGGPAPAVDGQAVVWNLGTVDAGASGDVDVTARITTALQLDTPITNTATIAGVEADRNPADNGAAAGAVALAETRDLRVLESLIDGPPVAGRPITYHVAVTNLGNRPVPNVWVTDTLPVSTTYGTANAFNLAALANGGSIAGYSSSNGGCWGDVTKVIDGQLGTVDCGQWASAYGQVSNQSITVRLASGAIVDRIRLDPSSIQDYPRWMKDFGLWVSTDGATYTKVLTATALAQHGLQEFRFDPVPAQYVQLEIVNNWGDPYHVEAGELEVYAAPAEADGVTAWWLGNLNGGQSREFDLAVRLGTGLSGGLLLTNTVRVSGDSPETSDANNVASLTLPAMATRDPYETGDVLTTAYTLPLGVPIAAYLEAGEDVDWYAIDLSGSAGPGAVQIDFGTPPTTTSSSFYRLDVYTATAGSSLGGLSVAPDGRNYLDVPVGGAGVSAEAMSAGKTPLPTSPPGGERSLAGMSGANGRLAVLAAPADSSATRLYVRIAGDGGAYNPFSPYRLNAFFYPTEGGPTNDTLDTATPITATAPITALIARSGDVDFYSVRITTAPSRVWAQFGAPPNLTAGGTTPGTALRVEIDGPSGTRLTYADVSPSNNGAIAYDTFITGTSYVQISGNGGSFNPQQPYTLTAGVSPGHVDRWEPNDSHTSAYTVTTGGPIAAYASSGGDEDWYAVVVTRPSHLRAALQMPPSMSDGYLHSLELRDQDGTAVLWSSGVYPGGSLSIDREILMTGTYYLRLAPVVVVSYCGRYSCYSYSVPGEYNFLEPYTLTVNLLSDLDPWEPNENAASAMPVDVGLGLAITGAISLPADRDWFTFPITAPHGNLSVNLRVPGTNAGGEWGCCYGYQARLYRRTGDGSLTYVTSVYAWPNTIGSFSANVWQGVYYLRVSNDYGDAEGNPSGAWNLVDPYVASLTFTPGDGFESNDSFGLATPLQWGVPMTAHVSVAGDADWFSVTVPSGVARVRLALQVPGTNAGGGWSCCYGYTARLFGPDGTASPGYVYSWPGQSGYADFFVSGPGTHYIRVDDAYDGDENQHDGAWNGVDPYYVTVSAGAYADPWEPAEVYTQAVPLRVGVPTAGHISTIGDTDWFSMTVPSAVARLHFDLQVPGTYAGGGRGCCYGYTARLYGPDGTSSPGYVYVWPDRGGYADFDVFQAGTYYVRVNDVYDGDENQRYRAWNAYEPYYVTLGVAPGNVDPAEPNDVITQAVTITTGLPVGGYLSTGSDVDWYAIPMTGSAANSVEVVFQMPPTTNNGRGRVVRLLGPDGVTSYGSGYVAPGETATLGATPNLTGTIYVEIDSAYDGDPCNGSCNSYNFLNPYVLTARLYNLSTDYLPPVVQSVSPAAGAAVSRMPAVSAVLADSGDPASGVDLAGSTIALSGPAGPITGTVGGDGNTIVLTPTVPIPTDGSAAGWYTTTVAPIDNAGNVGLSQTSVFLYDPVAPTSVLTPSYPVGPSGWYTAGALYLTLVGDDAAGGPVRSFGDRFDAPNAGAYTTGGFELAPSNLNGENVLLSAGTGSDYSSNFFRTAALPSSKLAVDLDFMVTAGDTDAHFALENSDDPNGRWGVIAGSGKLYVQYNTGSSGWIYPLDLINPVQTNVWYRLTLRADDRDGFSMAVYQKDNPLARGEYRLRMPIARAWRFHHWIYRHAAYIDNYQEQARGSGIATVTYRLDGGAWASWPGDMLMAEGVHTLDYYATDRAGNQEISHTTTLRVGTLPVLTAGPALATAAVYAAGDPGAITDTNRVGLVPYDGRYYTEWTNYLGSGSHPFRLQPPYTVVQAGLIYAPVSGTYAIDAYGDDYVRILIDGVEIARNSTNTNVGLSQGTHRFRMEYVNTAGRGYSYHRWMQPGDADWSPIPVLQGIDGDFDPNGWFHGPVTTTLAGLDAGPGVAATLYRLDGGAWLTYTAPFSVTASGIHTLDYRSIDNLGAVEVTRTAYLKVDNQPPAAAIAPTGVITSLVGVTATLGDDASSGGPFTDHFDALDSSAWTFPGGQTAPYGLDSRNVLRNSGYGANFYRNRSYPASGTVYSADFQVSGTNSNSYLTVESNDDGYYRFGVIAQDGYIRVEALDPYTSYHYYPKILINPVVVGAWYRLTIVADDQSGFVVRIAQLDRPDRAGEYRTKMTPGKTWRFHAWGFHNDLYLDDYAERAGGPSLRDSTIRIFRGTNPDLAVSYPITHTNYADRESTSWVITDPRFYELNLHFNGFSTEPGFDLVRIYELATDRLLRTYSGDLGSFDTGYLGTNRVQVVFTSDTSATAPGFVLGGYFGRYVAGGRRPTRGAGRSRSDPTRRFLSTAPPTARTRCSSRRRTSPAGRRP